MYAARNLNKFFSKKILVQVYFYSTEHYLNEHVSPYDHYKKKFKTKLTQLNYFNKTDTDKFEI